MVRLVFAAALYYAPIAVADQITPAKVEGVFVYELRSDIFYQSCMTLNPRNMH